MVVAPGLTRITWEATAGLCPRGFHEKHLEFRKEVLSNHPQPMSVWARGMADNRKLHCPKQDGDRRGHRGSCTDVYPD